MAILTSVKIPYLEQVAGADGLIVRSWQLFFRALLNLVEPLGAEKTFDLLNNQSTVVYIKGFNFESKKETQAFVDYNIQRTTSTSELVESGVLRVVYMPKTEVWAISVVGTSGPDSSGVTFTITSDGYVQYTSTNVGGTPITFKVSTRSRTLSGKNNL